MVTFNVDSLDFVDDEEARFGADADFATRFDSANTRLELEDLTNATVGYVPQNVGTDLVGGKFAETVSEGKALADDGNVYDSIQEAVNNASSWVKVGPGTFNENITISADGFTLKGSGKRTMISGKNNHAITIEGADTLISDISAKTNKGSNLNRSAVYVPTGSNGSNCIISNVTVPQAGEHGVKIETGSNYIINGCEFDNCDMGVRPVFSAGEKIVAVNNKIINSRKGVNLDNGDDSIIAGNIITRIENDAISIFESNDCIVFTNRIDICGSVGIDIFGNGEEDNIIVNNRISNCETAIEDEGIGTLIQDNLITE